MFCNLPLPRKDADMAKILQFPTDPDKALLASRRAAIAAVGHDPSLADGLDTKTYNQLLALFKRVRTRENAERMSREGAA